MAGSELPLRRPRWWSAVDWLQRVFALAALAGLAWLLALVGVAFLRLEDVVPVPEVEGVPVPTGLLIGGAALGLALALLARIANRVSARRRARRAEAVLRRRVAQVGDARVLAPVEAELEARVRLCRAVACRRQPADLRLDVRGRRVQ